MPTQAPTFNAWLDDFFAAYYRQRPVNATFIGVHAHDDRLPDFSAQGLDELQAETQTVLQRLHALPDEPLTEAEAIDRRLAEGFLHIQQWEQQSNHFARGNPSMYTGEAAFGVISLLRRPFAPLTQRLEAAIARMDAIPALLAQGKANVRQAPAAWIERALDECAGLLVLLQNGIALLAYDQPRLQRNLRAAANRAVAAVEDFARYLKRDLRAGDGGSACGADAHDLLLRRGHFLSESAATILAYAQEQFAAAESYLQAHARDFGARTWPEALAQLQSIHPPVARYYARYDELWEACRVAAEQHELVTWPEYPIRYVPQPAWARAAAPHLYFLFYHSPAPFDQLPEVEYFVTPIDAEMPIAEQERRLHATNDNVIKLNHVVHHGAIGHHVQNWYAFRAASRIGQIAAVDCASRIAMFCGGTMAEGWACYATELMDEIGFLTPLEHYAEQHSRLRMAARAIVDVRLHHGEITLDEAAAFYGERVGMAAGAAKGEAIKNSMFPGTALMYLMGVDTIHALRRELSTRPSFCLRAFHDRLLSYGSVPVTLVADALRRDWPPAASSTNRAQEAVDVE